MLIKLTTDLHLHLFLLSRPAVSARAVLLFAFSVSSVSSGNCELSSWVSDLATVDVALSSMVYRILITFIGPLDPSNGSLPPTSFLSYMILVSCFQLPSSNDVGYIDVYPLFGLYLKILLPALTITCFSFISHFYPCLWKSPFFWQLTFSLHVSRVLQLPDWRSFICLHNVRGFPQLIADVDC